MPALSTSTIAASASAGKAAARSGTHGADKSGDGSPFAALLAATSQQNPPPRQQGAPQAANNNDASAAKNTDPQNDTAQAASSPRSRGDVAKDSGKHDKKADSDKDAPEDGAAAAQQAQQAQPPVQAALAIIPPVIPANAQAPGATEGETGPDTIEAASSMAANGGPAAAAAGAGGGTNAQPAAGNQAAPQPAPQPAPANPGPVAQTPIAMTDEIDSTATDTPVTISARSQTNGPAPQPKTGDSKAAGDKTAATKSAGKPQVDPQTLSQPAPVMDDDAEAAPQAVAVTSPAGNSPDTPAPNGDATLTAAAPPPNVQPSPAEKPDTKNAAPASKPVQAVADAAMPPPAIKAPVTSPAPFMAAAPGNDTANGTDSVQAASNGDGKPSHQTAADAAPRPDAPAPQTVPAPQIAPPPAPPQAVAANGFGVPSAAANTGGAAIATTLHIAASDADPTPNIGALAVSIAARSLSGARQFEIRLDPPELGRVDVRLSIDASGKTQAHMTADQPQTLDLLQKDAPSLTQALRDAGLDVSQSGLNFSLRGQDRRNDDSNNGAGQGRRTNLTATRAIQATQNSTAISINGAAADARVDIHV